jgi:hypothetical protein
MFDIDNEVELVTDIFKKVFNILNPKPFGSRSIGVKGICDGNFGVQWNTWVDIKNEYVMIGVNLEGLQYYEWPISKFILRELEEPFFLELARKVQNPREVEVTWQRDAWQINSRPPIKERKILQKNLNDVTTFEWKQALEQALSCLNKERGYRGRALQEITTLPNEVRVVKQVSPHLYFSKKLWANEFISVTEKEKKMRKNREILLPLYDFVKDRSAS